jgi:hypothetical protein
LSVVACLALAGYVVNRILTGPEGLRILVWFGAGAVAHDLLLWPLYAIADRGAVRVHRRHPDRLPAVPWINHLRVPAVISGTLLAVSFPLVLRLSDPTYRAATGLTESPYLGRWLLVTAVLFAASAFLYAARVGRAVRRARLPGLAAPVEHR